MKKNLIYIATSLLIGFASCGEKHTTDVEDMGMSGDVHKLSEFKYYAEERFGEVTRGEAFREEGEWDREIIFNKAGYFDTVRLTTSTGDDVGSITYAYNKQGQKVCEKNYDAEGNPVDKSVFFYKNDKIAKIEKYNAEESVSGRVNYEYDEENKLNYTRYYNFKGELLQTIEQSMSKRGLPSVTKIYGREGDLANWREEKYNSAGLLEKLTVKEPDGNVTMVVSFLYDENGNAISQTAVDGQGEAFVPHTWKYTFDDHNNWLTCTEYEGGKPLYITVRTIEYFSK